MEARPAALPHSSVDKEKLRILQAAMDAGERNFSPEHGFDTRLVKELMDEGHLSGHDGTGLKQTKGFDLIHVRITGRGRSLLESLANSAEHPAGRFVARDTQEAEYNKKYPMRAAIIVTILGAVAVAALATAWTAIWKFVTGFL